jgi:hypothetical protein
MITQLWTTCAWRHTMLGETQTNYRFTVHYTCLWKPKNPVALYQIAFGLCGPPRADRHVTNQSRRDRWFLLVKWDALATPYDVTWVTPSQAIVCTAMRSWFVTWLFTFFTFWSALGNNETHNNHFKTSQTIQVEVLHLKKSNILVLLITMNNAGSTTLLHPVFINLPQVIPFPYLVPGLQYGMVVGSDGCHKRVNGHKVVRSRIPHL